MDSANVFLTNLACPKHASNSHYEVYRLKTSPRKIFDRQWPNQFSMFQAIEPAVR
jgi:hypothetical protein